MIETSLSVTKASHRRNDSRLDRRINVPSLRCASWGAGASQTLDLSPAAVRMRSMLYVHRVHAACISFFFFYCFLNAASPCMSPINSSSEPMVLSPPWIHDASPKIASSLVTRKRSDGFGELCVVSLLGSVVYHPSLTVNTKLNIMSSTEQTPESFCFFFFFFFFSPSLLLLWGRQRNERSEKEKLQTPKVERKRRTSPS